MRQAIQQGHSDIAKIYAQNAIRKQNERLNLLRLGSRIDAVASRVQTAVTMRQVTGSMMNVVKGMDQAMKAMDLEKVGLNSSDPLLPVRPSNKTMANGNRFADLCSDG
jgi:charged multivesicular body protein 1